MEAASEAMEEASEAMEEVSETVKEALVVTTMVVMGEVLVNWQAPF